MHMADKKKPAKNYDNGKKGKVDELFLVVQGDDNNFYVASDARLVPTDYNEDIRAYTPKKGDGVFQSPRAFLVTVSRDNNLEKFLTGNLKGPPKPPK